MIQNFDDFPSLQGFGDLITAETLDDALSLYPATNQYSLADKVWEWNQTLECSTGITTTEVLIRVDVEHYLRIEATRLLRPDGLFLFIIRSVEVSTTAQTIESTPIGSQHPPRRQLYRPSQDPIGDLSCVHNARSPYLRCAINPCGPCDGCEDYTRI